MGNLNLFSLIRTKYNTLSSSQKNVANYVLENPNVVIYSTLSGLAAKLNVSETTILRFLRKLDYDSYQVFKVHMAQQLAEGTGEVLYEEITDSDSTEQIIDKVISSTAKCIMDAKQSLDVEQLEQFVTYIMEAKKIFIIGIGASSAIAFDMYHKFLKLGLNCSFSSNTHIINIACNSLCGEDLLICFSHTGESQEILTAVEFAKKNGCPVCSITSYENSHLASLSSCMLLSSSIETQYRSDSMTSRIIQLTFIDMLYISLASKLGDTAIKKINRSREAVAVNKK